MLEVPPATILPSGWSTRSATESFLPGPKFVVTLPSGPNRSPGSVERTTIIETTVSVIPREGKVTWGIWIRWIRSSSRDNLTVALHKHGRSKRKLAAAKAGPHRAIRAEPVTGGTVRETAVIDTALIVVIETTVPVIPHEGNVTGRVYRPFNRELGPYHSRQYDLTVGLNGNIVSNALGAIWDRCLDNPKDTKSRIEPTADLIAHRRKLRRLRTTRSTRSSHQHDLAVVLQDQGIGTIGRRLRAADVCDRQPTGPEAGVQALVDVAECPNDKIEVVGVVGTCPGVTSHRDPAIGQDRHPDKVILSAEPIDVDDDPSIATKARVELPVGRLGDLVQGECQERGGSGPPFGCRTRAAAVLAGRSWSG